MDTTCDLALGNNATSTSQNISLVANVFTILACTLQLVLGVLHRCKTAMVSNGAVMIMDTD